MRRVIHVSWVIHFEPLTVQLHRLRGHLILDDEPRLFEIQSGVGGERREISDDEELHLVRAEAKARTGQPCSRREE